MKRAVTALSRHTTALVLALAASTATHAQGFERVTATAAKIEALLNSLSIVTVTIGIMIAGYMWLFRAARVDVLAWIIGGAVLIGGAAQIAAFLVGG